jgi:hypothetical protein
LVDARGSRDVPGPSRGKSRHDGRFRASRPARRALGLEPESRAPRATPTVALAVPSATLSNSRALWLTSVVGLTGGLPSGAIAPKRRTPSRLRLDGMHGACLYYPRIAIPGDAWLKSTLLLLDSVRRIMPEYAGVHDEPEVDRFIRADLVQATSPFDYRERAEKIFMEKLSVRDGEDRTLEDALRLGVRHPDPEVLDSSERIHIEKVSDSLVHRLGELGLVRRADGGWLQFDSRVGALYMTCLATAMSDAINAPLVTDESPYLGWAHLFAATPRAIAADPLIPCLAALNIEWPDMGALAAIPTDRFLAFHELRSTERKAFREALLTIVAELASIEDRNQLGDAIAKHRREFEQRLRDLREAQQELGLNTLVGALSINCPTLIAAAAATPFVGPGAGALIAGSGLALSAASWAADLRGAHRGLRRSDPLYYALAVRSDL